MTEHARAGQLKNRTLVHHIKKRAAVVPSREELNEPPMN